MVQELCFLGKFCRKSSKILIRLRSLPLTLTILFETVYLGCTPSRTLFSSVRTRKRWKLTVCQSISKFVSSRPPTPPPPHIHTLHSTLHVTPPLHCSILSKFQIFAILFRNLIEEDRKIQFFGICIHEQGPFIHELGFHWVSG